MFKALKTLLAASSLTAAAACTGEDRNAPAHDVRTEGVLVEAEWADLSGEVFVPEGLSPGAAAVGAVVLAPRRIDEVDMAALYARELAKRGVVALALDGRVLREDDTRAVEAVRAAARVLLAREDVGAVGGVGGDAGARAMAKASIEIEPLSRLVLIDPRLTRDDASVAAQLRTPFLIVGAGRARHSFVTQAFLTASPAPKGNAWREVLGKDMILKDQASIAYIAGAGAAHLTGANGIGVTTPLR